MKRKWKKGMFGVEALDPDSEFLPRKYKVKVVDLRKFGIPTVPVVGQTSYRQLDEPSGWHVHRNCIEFVYCAAGSCEYESKGRRYRLRPGMMFVSRADEEHRQLDCPKGYATYCLLFRPAGNSASRWFETAMAKMPRLFPCCRSIPTRFARIFSLVEGGKTGQELQMRLQTEVRSLFFDILDSTCRATGNPRGDAFGEIAAKMRIHPEREYPLDELVAESGKSKASFMALFKTAHGRSPRAYLISCRVDAAKDLLRKGVSVKDIVDRVGFVTPQNLTRAFKNYVGLTPKEWVVRNKA